SGRNQTRLTPQEAERARQRAIELGMPGENIELESGPGANTGWGQIYGREKLYIADDLKPAIPEVTAPGQGTRLTGNQRVTMDGLSATRWSATATPIWQGSRNGRGTATMPTFLTRRL